MEEGQCGAVVNSWTFCSYSVVIGIFFQTALVDFLISVVQCFCFFDAFFGIFCPMFFFSYSIVIGKAFFQNILVGLFDFCSPVFRGLPHFSTFSAFS